MDDLREFMPNAVTLPQYFQQKGYYVGGASKVFHGSDTEETWWDAFFDPPRNPIPDNIPAHGIQSLGNLDWDPLPESDSSFADFATASWAIEQLQQSFDQPFMMMVGIEKPHLPWYLPQHYFDLYPHEAVTLPPFLENDLDDLPEYALALVDGLSNELITTNNLEEQAVQAYLASISFVDTQVGRILDALEVSPNAENTIIILASDHGFHLGEKHHWKKFTLWENSTRIPLIISVPGGLQDVEVHQPVGLIDLYPTLIDLAGLIPKHDLEGHSLVPLLINPAYEWPYYALTTYRRRGDNAKPLHAVRTNRWRYIRYYANSGALAGEELYDHDADPNEWINLAGDPTYADIKTKLFAYLEATVLSSELQRKEMPSVSPRLQNYPNPFRSITTILYETVSPSRVQLVVFNVHGRTVRRLIDAMQLPGRHQVVFDAGDLPSGVYLYRLQTETTLVSQKMTLTR